MASRAIAAYLVPTTLISLLALGFPAAAAPEPESWLWLGPDGEPLPFSSHQQALDFLSSAKVLSSEPIPVGVTNPKKMLLELDGVRAHAVFRNYHKEQRNVPTSRGRVIRFLRDSYRNELAAYELDRLLGLDMVPPVVARRIRSEDGSLQIWIEDVMTEEKRNKEGLEPPDRLRWLRSYQTMVVFDNLINNIDRNQGNILIDKNWSLWLIDHTRSFSRDWSLPKKSELTACGRKLWEAIQRLDEEVTRKRLSPYLASTEITALFKRRDQIVEILGRRIEELGEGKVLFSTD